MNLGTAQILRADARDLPLADNTVDLVVTSPPYFSLRSYQDGGEHYAGQIGDEPTPAEFVDSLLAVTRECVRVLKPSGSLWVNLGDKYASYEGNRGAGRSSLQGSTDRSRPDVPSGNGLAGGGAVRAKSLMGIPWRYALRCIDDLGLILRAEVIWSKPNGLPESVTDRVRRSHEQWFHFTREPRYYSAVDEIREPYLEASVKRIAAGYNPIARDAIATERNGVMRARGAGESTEGYEPNPLGKLPGSVWTVPTEPLKVPDELGIDHFAAFPTEWPKRIIQGWSPTGVCIQCGEGRRPIGQSVRTFDGAPIGPGEGGIFGGERTVTRNKGVGNWRFGTERNIAGFACVCPEPTAPTTPGVVLDPFGGTGTTALVAKALGQHGISVDMSADYCRIARWRTTDRDQLAKVLGVAKAEQQPAEQLSMFDL